MIENVGYSHFEETRVLPVKHLQEPVKHLQEPVKHLQDHLTNLHIRASVIHHYTSIHFDSFLTHSLWGETTYLNI